MKQEEIRIQSTLDGSLQPSLLYRPDLTGKQPLLVGLHTWSHDRFNQVSRMVPWAEALGFGLLLPEFRGPNLDTNPRCTQACGSEYAMRDIRDAIDECIRKGIADPAHIFLYGASGGGHMALMMAGNCPEYFEAIAAFVPITDLEKWADENAVYRRHVCACCSNDPIEMAKRSPMSYIDGIARANVKIFHGKYDPTVPVGHSIRLFTEIMLKYPQNHVYLDVFDGGHETDELLALHWIRTQYQKRKLTTVTG